MVLSQSFAKNMGLYGNILLWNISYIGQIRDALNKKRGHKCYCQCALFSLNWQWKCFISTLHLENICNLVCFCHISVKQFSCSSLLVCLNELQLWGRDWSSLSTIFIQLFPGCTLLVLFRICLQWNNFSLQFLKLIFVATNFTFLFRTRLINSSFISFIFIQLLRGCALLLLNNCFNRRKSRSFQCCLCI